MLNQYITRYWYNKHLHLISYLLLPASWLFSLCVSLRRYLYRHHFLATHHFPVPIIVVGNITVGGTGKTPFVIWLANFLREQGYHPGIVSRGVGGKQQTIPRLVKQNDHAAEVGDEALLIANKSRCPLAIGIDRAEAVRMLLTKANCDIIISDDGLQHYRLARDIEIALVDGERRFGNECLLPAGPLREPMSRLKEVDLIVVKDGGEEDEWSVSVLPTQFVTVKKPDQMAGLTAFANKKVHAVAGIANPEKFFSMLRRLNIDIVPQVFPDHYFFQKNDLIFADDLPIIMTEKDAVKCREFSGDHHWYLDIKVQVESNLQQRILTLLRELSNEAKSNVDNYSCGMSCKH